MALLKNKPHSEWIQPEPLSVQQIDFYLGRVPEWYIEQKFLKKPGTHFRIIFFVLPIYEFF